MKRRPKELNPLNLGHYTINGICREEKRFSWVPAIRPVTVFITPPSSTTPESPGPSRFANAGRPARTRMIRRNLLTQSHYFPVQPRLKPVNSSAESRSTWTGYGLSR
ncbi:hypothetical protein DPMN_101203 [Dreissena polymorpha]|uniref:Uncharacterized protein n=1 Tax=Dreissena polymorpha TaxID=45954 RepID=A0A9D4LH61_DREPO|nr:hypothetical protein DPMN_101203 [Dreissena polymorpha]